MLAGSSVKENSLVSVKILSFTAIRRERDCPQDLFAKIQMIPQAWTNPYWRYHSPLIPTPIHRQNYPGDLFRRRHTIIISDYYLLA